MESKIQVPLIRNPESSSLNPEPPLIPEFKIVLDYLTRGDGSPPPGRGGGGGEAGYSVIYRVCTVFWTKNSSTLHFPFFKDSISAKKRMESMYLLGFPQRE